MPIEAILFDADGVLQERPEGWRDALSERLGFRGDAEVFLADVYDVETPILDGQSDFVALFSSLLSRWNCSVTLEEALRIWTMLHVEADIIETVRALKRHGVACHLASNQERYKARYMSEVLGYGELFEREYYSCHLGVKKPDQRYFRAILSDLALPPDRVLFIDDRQANVDSARHVGLHAFTFHLTAGKDDLHRQLAAHGFHLPSPT
jgi:HAD superfamily hydrolase (TIGR01509 family)